VLVKTGVWDETRDGSGHGATIVEDNVETAVERILSFSLKKASVVSSK
jgi:hypothetical protein